jgi:hypothetical protein
MKERNRSALLGRRVDLVPQPMLKWAIGDRVVAEAQPIHVRKS